MLSLFLVGLGARLWLIHRFGTPLPFWDQWEDARVVYAPYFEGKLSLANLFSAHNEHRIFFGRVYGLALLLLNRQWDGQLEMVVDAIIHCATLAGLGWLMSRWLERRCWIMLWLPLALVLALPFGWENSLAGFQSVFYFFMLLSLLTLWLLGTHPPGSARWWVGAAASILALFTLASGFLAAAAVFGLVVFRVWHWPKTWKQQSPTLALCAAVVVAGLLLKADVAHHHVLQAHSVGEFLAALGANLAWPWIVVSPFALLNLLPLAALAWCYYSREDEQRPAEELTLAISLWAILQGAAVAYARGAEGKPPGWRYMDSSSFILIAACFSIAILRTRYLGASRWGAVWHTAFIAWGVACATGLALLTLRAWQIDIPERQFYQRCQLLNTRAYMANGDIRVFDHKPNPQLPIYEGDPDAPRAQHEGEKFVQYLNLPGVRGILPACVHDPLKVVPEKVTGFVTNGAAHVKPRIPGEVFWSSYTNEGAATKGRFESLPVSRTRLPFLEFRVAGDLGQPGLSLTLMDLSSGKLTSVKPLKAPGDDWRTCRVRAPHGDFKIIAVDESSSGTGWFAFQAPREVGWLSWAAGELASFGGSLFLAGLSLFVAGVVFAFCCRPGGDAFYRSPNRAESLP
jgi:hypothetical protein